MDYIISCFGPPCYHQVALLLPIGRVWTAGSTPTRRRWELRTEFFRPIYLSVTLPNISGVPTLAGYGGSITISTPNPSSITRASLIECLDTTHHYDSNMRLVWLRVTSRTSNSITVEAPLSGNLAPPGFYYIHILNSSNISSPARTIRIPS